MGKTHEKTFHRREILLAAKNHVSNLINDHGNTKETTKRWHYWQKLTSLTILNVGENVEQAIPSPLLKHFGHAL